MKSQVLFPGLMLIAIVLSCNKDEGSFLEPVSKDLTRNVVGVYKGIYAKIFEEDYSQNIVYENERLEVSRTGRNEVEIKSLGNSNHPKYKTKLLPGPIYLDREIIILVVELQNISSGTVRGIGLDDSAGTYDPICDQVLELGCNLLTFNIEAVIHDKTYMLSFIGGKQ